MKKLVCMLCTLAMLFAAIGMFSVSAAEATVPAEASKWDGTIPAGNKEYAFEGKGTEAEPWLIKSAAEFAQFAANVRMNDKDTSYGGMYFKLTVDIDMDNHGWLGIGGAKADTGDGLSTKEEDTFRYSYFAGNFDGDNHKIYNFALAASGKKLNTETGVEETVPLHHQGLFGVIMGATIKNLGIESGNVVLDQNNNRSAAFVGVGRCGFLIENCYNKADVTITSNIKQAIVGAFAGQVIDPWNNANNTEQTTEGIFSKKQMINCYNTGDLIVNLNQTDSANQFRIGGIAGQYVGGAPEMLGVWNLGDITINYNSVASSNGNRRVGGITGALLDSAYVENLYYKGTIKVVAPEGTDLTSNFTLGMLFGSVSGNATSEPNGDGVYTVGYCAGADTTAVIAAKGVGSHADPAAWYAAVADVEIPLAEGSTFIVDIHATPDQGGNDQVTTEGSVVTTAKPDDDDDDKVVTTAKPVTTTATPAATTAAPTTTEDDGCASSMGILSVLLMTGIASGAALCVSRRKNEE